MDNLPNQSTSWGRRIEEFHEWKARVAPKCDAELTELVLYLSDQLVIEGAALHELKFNAPLLGMVNYLGEHNLRARELMLAYLTLVVSGNDVPARLLVAGQRLQPRLHPEYVERTRCYGVAGDQVMDKDEREALVRKLVKPGDTLTHTRCMGCVEEHIYTGDDGHWLCGKPTKDTVRLGGSRYEADDISPRNVTHINRVPVGAVKFLANNQTKEE